LTLLFLFFVEEKYSWYLNAHISSSLGQVLLQEAQEEALQAALNTFNLEAVGGGTSRKKYEKDLYITIKKQFEVSIMCSCDAYCTSVNAFLSVSLFRSLRLYKFRMEWC
jgi:hypothetical protein